MMFYTAAINGVFAFLIAGALWFTADGVTNAFLLNLIFYIVITPVISLTLTKMMYMSENNMIVKDALERIDGVLSVGPMSESKTPEHPADSSVELNDVHFSYDGKNEVIRGVSMNIGAGQTVALIGPSGGGKSTLAGLIARFFDVKSGSIKVGGADIREIPKEELMNAVSFVFQDSKLIKATIAENVKLRKTRRNGRRSGGGSSCRAVRRYHTKISRRSGHDDRDERSISFGRREAANSNRPCRIEKRAYYYS